MLYFDTRAMCSGQPLEARQGKATHLKKNYSEIWQKLSSKLNNSERYASKVSEHYCKLLSNL